MTGWQVPRERAGEQDAAGELDGAPPAAGSCTRALHHSWPAVWSPRTCRCAASAEARQALSGSAAPCVTVRPCCRCLSGG